MSHYKEVYLGPSYRQHMLVLKTVLLILPACFKTPEVNWRICPSATWPFSPFSLLVHLFKYKQTRQIFQQSSLKGAEFFKVQTEARKLQSTANSLSLSEEEWGSTEWQLSLGRKYLSLQGSSLRQELNKQNRFWKCLKLTRFSWLLSPPRVMTQDRLESRSQTSQVAEDFFFTNLKIDSFTQYILSSFLSLCSSRLPCHLPSPLINFHSVSFQQRAGLQELTARQDKTRSTE